MIGTMITIGGPGHGVEGGSVPCFVLITRGGKVLESKQFKSDSNTWQVNRGNGFKVGKLYIIIARQTVPQLEKSHNIVMARAINKKI